MIKKDMIIAICGFGKMGEALAVGLRKKEVFASGNIHCTTARASSEHRVTEHGFVYHKTNPEAAKEADIILLATKPGTIGKLVQEISTVVNNKQLIISIAAGVTIAQIEEKLKDNQPVIRAMPNTPALIGEGMTVISKGGHSTTDHMQQAESIFESVGKVVALDEKHMDAVTGLSGSGPAYVFLIIEALAEAGVKVGLSREISLLLTAQTLLGASKLLLETNAHPALLKDQVTTPAGTAIDGLLALEQGGLRTCLINAVVKATERAGKLGKN
jgi:pyrroline-5-carboxylate reductase